MKYYTSGFSAYLLSGLLNLATAAHSAYLKFGLNHPEVWPLWPFNMSIGIFCVWYAFSRRERLRGIPL